MPQKQTQWIVMLHLDRCRHKLSSKLLCLLGILINLGKITVLLFSSKFPGLGFLLFCFPGLHTRARAGTGAGLCLSPSLELANDEIPHKPSLKKTNCNQTVEPDKTSVEVTSLQINLLLLGRKLCQTKPKGENGKDD